MNFLCADIPILFMLLMLLLEVWKAIELFLMRKKGSFPQKGYETLTDVENLLKENQRVLAITCYRLIDTLVSWKVAEKEVDKIALELKIKYE
jgi:hypothetical protein